MTSPHGNRGGDNGAGVVDLDRPEDKCEQCGRDCVAGSLSGAVCACCLACCEAWTALMEAWGE